MPTLPTRGRFAAGFLAGAVLAAAASAGAQGAFMRLSGGQGLPPGGSGFVMCTNAAMSELRAGVSPTTSLMPTSHGGVAQASLVVRCPP